MNVKKNRGRFNINKIISLLFITGGTMFLLFVAIQIWDTNAQQKEVMNTARDTILTQDPYDINLFDEDRGYESNKKSEIINNHDKVEKDPFDDFQPQISDVIGVLTIPKINAELPILFGVNEAELHRGVGHYPGTSFPGQSGQIVFSGHRDTVFKRLGELEDGDQFIVDMPYGHYVYKVNEIEIVDKDDRTVINPNKQGDKLTVTTCYPFRFIGDAPQRYIIHAKPKYQE